MFSKTICSFSFSAFKKGKTSILKLSLISKKRLNILRKELLFLFFIVLLFLVFCLLFIAANVKKIINQLQSFFIKLTKIYNR